MSAETTVQALIDEQNTRASTALTAAQRYGDQAQEAAFTITNLPAAPNVTAENVNITMPVDYDPASEFERVYNGAFADYSPQFNTLFQNFIDDFFPNVDGCVAQLSDAWLCNTIQNGGTGIPAVVEGQIWDRARAREEEVLHRSIQDANDGWAGRGFALPPGAVVQQVARAQVEANNKLSTLSRDVAIKNVEIEIENVRFAISEGIKLRLGAVQAASDYIKTWFLSPQTAIEKAKALTETRYRFYANTAAYYNAIINASELKLKAAMFNSDLVVKNNHDFMELITRNSQARVSAAVGSAEAMGKAAAAALGALNTLANLGNVTTIQQ